MNKHNKSIIINKPFVAAPQLNVHLSKNQAKAIKWMSKRLVDEGLLTTLEDLTQFVRSKNVIKMIIQQSVNLPVVLFL
jgi:hypothetical protein